MDNESPEKPCLVDREVKHQLKRTNKDLKLLQTDGHYFNTKKVLHLKNMYAKF